MQRLTLYQRQLEQAVTSTPSGPHLRQIVRCLRALFFTFSRALSRLGLARLRNLEHNLQCSGTSELSRAHFAIVYATLFWQRISRCQHSV